MLSSLKNIIAAPLTKYMGIAILVLTSALGGALYLSYKFYGDKEVAQAESEQLAVTVEQEREQTDKAIKSSELINESVAKVREGERDIDKASQELQEKLSRPTPTQPTGEQENEKESTTEPCDHLITDDDVRLLQQAHCLTDGDTSDCN